MVLIRALRPIHGIGLVAKRRGSIWQSPFTERKLRDFCNGPGKLCQAMGIGKGHQGVDLCGTCCTWRRGPR